MACCKTTQNYINFLCCTGWNNTISRSSLYCELLRNCLTCCQLVCILRLSWQELTYDESWYRVELCVLGLAWLQISKLDQIHNFYLLYIKPTENWWIYNFNLESTNKNDWCNRQVNGVCYIGIKLWVKCGREIGLLDSWVLALVLISRVQPWPRPLDFGLDYNTAPSFYWVGLGRDFKISIGLGWVGSASR